jgi:predicted regulator of Ras-like GTPase activity (Roadblock/LC7/MglB family)
MMSIADQLDDLRRAIPGCSAVVLGDLSAGLVLRASLARQMPQEELDRLCALAAAVLAGPVAVAAANGSGADHAALLSGGNVRVFVRSPGDDADVLCCLCPPDVDITAAAALARSVLAGIAAGP